MTRFRAAFLLVPVVFLAGCADATGPGRLNGEHQPQVFSASPTPDGTGASTASEDGEPVLRDGGNMMGGGGRTASEDGELILRDGGNVMGGGGR